MCGSSRIFRARNGNPRPLCSPAQKERPGRIEELHADFIELSSHQNASSKRGNLSLESVSAANLSRTLVERKLLSEEIPKICDFSRNRSYLAVRIWQIAGSINLWTYKSLNHGCGSQKKSSLKILSIFTFLKHFCE